MSLFWTSFLTLSVWIGPSPYKMLANFKISLVCFKLTYWSKIYKTSLNFLGGYKYKTFLISSVKLALKPFSKPRREYSIFLQKYDFPDRTRIGVKASLWMEFRKYENRMSSICWMIFRVWDLVSTKTTNIIFRKPLNVVSKKYEHYFSEKCFNEFRKNLRIECFLRILCDLQSAQEQWMASIFAFASLLFAIRHKTLIFIKNWFYKNKLFNSVSKFLKSKIEEISLSGLCTHFRFSEFPNSKWFFFFRVRLPLFSMVMRVNPI